MSQQQKFRLVTRSDFDGLVCAVLLKQLELIDEIKFVHPKDMQDGLIEITEHDIVTNLPYVKEAHMVFDHHLSETIRNQGARPNHVIDPNAPSAARVVWDHYGGKSVFPERWIEMMAAVDKGDSAQFTRDEVLDSQSWNLLNFLMDARTGLGRFKEFRVSNYNLMMNLIENCRTQSIEQILVLPDVQERVELYREHEVKFKEQIQRCGKVYRNLVLLDLTNEEVIYAGNRFIIYALFPHCNISIHKMWGFQQQNIVFATGKSIFDRSSKTNVGALMLKYGGGGHHAAGTCQIPLSEADRVQEELIKQINLDG
ncbi:exopolyphosphatase [Vibrio sp. V31_P5A7T61]|uniref:exopolyphosphatase n=1 Tax=unclassified Vibrio TaxID=2614977 RepID=UPI001372941E|nr:MULTISPECIES: exopolyphosphatase [unclassified Vibrio]NAW62086.1 exopolyphosphatase [Vibrio sp. V31_P5A7T61]NAW78370.1 exopolyphosphatase [Vibrio sp. V33_P6A3T137]NAX01979.1 exopolyphosphatase [Vibrio sp. V34_P3A8T189]NAX08369.1 exopolyphosphatase [Vibrio sp. V40_P2S30T141]NAX63048.1 exopolyphosphatase [Vibrio sp. V32_P6A28T40]